MTSVLRTSDRYVPKPAFVYNMLMSHRCATAFIAGWLFWLLLWVALKALGAWFQKMVYVMGICFFFPGFKDFKKGVFGLHIVGAWHAGDKLPVV